MVKRWRKVMPLFSGVLRSAWSGKLSSTGESSGGKWPSFEAMPSSIDVTLFEIERRSCFTSGANCTTPSDGP